MAFFCAEFSAPDERSPFRVSRSISGRPLLALVDGRQSAGHQAGGVLIVRSRQDPDWAWWLGIGVAASDAEETKLFPVTEVDYVTHNQKGQQWGC